MCLAADADEPERVPGITAASAIAPPNHASRVPWDAKRHDGND
jgi:hypothetical protein